MTSVFQKHQFTVVIVACQTIFMVLLGLFAKYDANAMPSGSEDSDYMATKYPMFQDTHVMIFVGFGFLMTFLKRYGYSAVSVNMLLACFTIEWSIITNGFLSEAFDRDGKFTIGLDQLLSADFAAATVLISMGAMLGKLTPVQYLVMTLIETPVALVIEHHVINTFHVNDVGDSIVVHAFGAYFGLACSKGFASKKQRTHENEGSVYHSDIFAMIGTIFLWVFWPSFNSATAETADSRQRAVCNTFLSLCACTIVTFLVSQATDRHPFLSSRVGIHDTCGVNNLHGMPGVLAGLLSAIFVVIYNPSDYGKSLNSIYPAMQSHSNTEGISAESQAINQLIGLGMVLVSSITSGLLTGVILRWKIFNQVREKEMYADDDYFDTPADYEFTTQVVSRIDHGETNEHTQLKQKDTKEAIVPHQKIFC